MADGVLIGGLLDRLREFDGERLKTLLEIVRTLAPLVRDLIELLKMLGL